jgi:CBS domain-containing protein
VAELRQQGGKAADIMTQSIITVRATNTIRQAAARMVDHDLKRLPVVAENSRLAGWISRLDIFRTIEYHQPASEAAAEPPPTGTTIAGLMYRDVPTILPQATLEEILQALEQNRGRRAVVVDADRRVVGIITDGDLLRRTQKEAHPGLLQRLRALVSGQPVPAPITLPEATETAADLMTTPVVTIAVGAAPATALRLMLEHGIKRLPVVDGDGRLVGLLGRASLLRGLLNKA